MSSKYEETLLQNRRFRILILNLSLSMILSLGIILFLVIKDKEIVRFVEFSKKGDFGVRVLDSSEISNTAKDLIIVSQLKEYIKSRVEKLGGAKYNKGEYDLAKFNYVKAFSSPQVFSGYVPEFQRIHKEAQFYERDVNIISAVRLQPSKMFLFGTISVDLYPIEILAICF